MHLLRTRDRQSKLIDCMQSKNKLLEAQNEKKTIDNEYLQNQLTNLQ